MVLAIPGEGVSRYDPPEPAEPIDAVEVIGETVKKTLQNPISYIPGAMPFVAVGEAEEEMREQVNEQIERQTGVPNAFPEIPGFVNPANLFADVATGTGEAIGQAGVATAGAVGGAVGGIADGIGGVIGGIGDTVGGITSGFEQLPKYLLIGGGLAVGALLLVIWTTGRSGAVQVREVGVSAV